MDFPGPGTRFYVKPDEKVAQAAAEQFMENWLNMAHWMVEVNECGSCELRISEREDGNLHWTLRVCHLHMRSQRRPDYFSWKVLLART